MLVERVVTELSDGTSELKELFLRPSTYSIPRVLFEAYMTDEESFEPYVPMGSYTTEEEEEEEETEETEEEETEEETEETEETDDTGFTLHQGEILETYYYQGISETSWENNYEDIDDNGSIKLVEIFDIDRLYKGVRCLITAENENYGKTLTRDTLEDVLLGFITEETFNEAGMELSISGMTKLMEEEYQFSFTQMKRSDIIIEVIKTAGLKPEVDPTGLNDEVIDYTNISKSSSSDSDDTGTGDTSGVDGDVVKLAKQVCSGKKGARNKANAICGWISANIPYPHPNYSNHQRCPSQVLKDRLSNCCDRARLGYQMGKVVGLTGRGVHGPGHVWVQYQIDGQWIDSDPSESRTSIGSTWLGMSMDRLWEFPEC